GGGRQRHLLVDLRGGVGDQSHVLDEDGQRGADVVEGAVDHASAAVAEHEGGGRSGAEHLVDLLQVQAHRVGERERLPGGGDVHSAQQLVDDLETLPVAGPRPHHGGVRGQGVEQRPHGGDVGLRPAHHDQQVAGRGAGGPAGDRRVHHVRGDPLEPCHGGLDRGGADGGHDQQRRGRPQHLDDPVLARQHGLELCGGRDHDHHDVRSTGRLAGGGGGGGDVGEGVAGRRVQVEGGDGESGLGGGAGHRRADRAQPDPGDRGGGAGAHQVLSFGRSQRAATAAVRVSTTSARACAPPTLPGKTT